jgi:hypothetical protein
MQSGISRASPAAKSWRKGLYNQEICQQAGFFQVGLWVFNHSSFQQKGAGNQAVSGHT